MVSILFRFIGCVKQKHNDTIISALTNMLLPSNLGFIHYNYLPFTQHPYISQPQSELCVSVYSLPLCALPQAPGPAWWGAVRASRSSG